jgi:hypothetical protein
MRNDRGNGGGMDAAFQILHAAGAYPGAFRQPFLGQASRQAVPFEEGAERPGGDGHTPALTGWSADRRWRCRVWPECSAHRGPKRGDVLEMCVL